MPSDIILEKELSYLIMQTAYEVHNTLGPGFPEKIYEEAMSRELPARGKVKFHPVFHGHACWTTPERIRQIRPFV